MPSLITQIILGPVLLLQGKKVRNSIVRLPEPEGERQGVCGAGPNLKLMIFGDSAAAGVGVPHQRQALAGRISEQLSKQFCVDWNLCANSGETTYSAMKMAQSLTADNFDVIIISLGVNDVTANLSKRRYIEHTTALITLIRDKFNPKHIIFSELPPMGMFPALPHPLRWYLGQKSKQLNSALKSIAKSHHCHCIAYKNSLEEGLIAEDGFHPGDTTYQLWAQAFAQLIQDLHDERSLRNTV